MFKLPSSPSPKTPPSGSTALPGPKLQPRVSGRSGTLMPAETSQAVPLPELERRTSPIDGSGSRRKLSPPPWSSDGLEPGPVGQGLSVPVHPVSSSALQAAAVDRVSPKGGQATLQAILDKHPAASSDAHLRKVTQPITGFGLIPDIAMDHFHVRKGRPGQRIAIGTRGIGPCVALCARATTALGEPVVGLGHLSSMADPKEALRSMVEAMQAQGAVDIKFHVVGGVLMRDPKQNLLAHVEKLLDAASEMRLDIVSAKLGTSESDDREHATDELLPSFGLPQCISAVVMSNEVVYADQAKDSEFMEGATRSLFAADFESEGTKLSHLDRMAQTGASPANSNASTSSSDHMPDMSLFLGGGRRMSSTDPDGESSSRWLFGQAGRTGTSTPSGDEIASNSSGSLPERSFLPGSLFGGDSPARPLFSRTGQPSATGSDSDRATSDGE